MAEYLGHNPLEKKENFYQDSMCCSSCKKRLPKRFLVCKCEVTKYCNPLCQKKHWKHHKANHKSLLKLGQSLDAKLSFSVGDLAMYKHDKNSVGDFKRDKKKKIKGLKEIVIIIQVHPGLPAPTTHYTVKILDSQLNDKRHNTNFDVPHGDRKLMVYDRPETTQRILFESCANGFTEIIAALVEQKGINLNQQHEHHQNQPTALHIATWANNVDIVKILVNAPSININLTTLEGATPLYIACHNGHLECVKVLCSSPDIDLNIRQHHGCTPLFCAADSNFSEIVEHLLTFPNCDVNQCNIHDRTPLIQASYKGKGDGGGTNEKVIRALLNHPEIDLNPTVNNLSAFGWARVQKHNHVVIEFYQYMCDHDIIRSDEKEVYFDEEQIAILEAANLSNSGEKKEPVEVAKEVSSSGINSGEMKEPVEVAKEVSSSSITSDEMEEPEAKRLREAMELLNEVD